MGSYLKIDPVRLGKFNKAEYASLMNDTKLLILEVGAEKIGVSQALLDAFSANVEKLTDIIVETRARIETIEINEEDRKACELVIYLMATIRANRSSPLEAMRVAAEALFLETKPCVGCQRLPQGQKLVMIRALLTDLTTEGMYAHVQTLHLADVVEELGVVAGRLGDLICQRTSQRAAERTEPAKVVRAEMDEQFDDILTIAFVTSVAHPSPEATRFVSLMNTVIAESETAYKQRTVQRTRRKKE